MDNFIVYDLILLGIFLVGISLFLYKNRKNVHREGLLLLHKTSWGIKLIDKIGTKYKNLLQKLSYVSVTLGYILMAVMIYLVGRVVYIYIRFPEAVRAIKVPPIMPLVPYLPQVFKLDFLPPFYFTYWIIIIAIIAITHEFFHGIFAAKNNVKIKKTGFGFFPFFLPIFLAAFVELDEKEMPKRKRFDQKAILAAGTFANVLTAILFFGVLWLFFSLAFAPAGVIFDNYPYTGVALGAITMVNGVQLNNTSYQNILDVMNETGLNSVKTNSRDYLITKSMLESQEQEEILYLYYDAPAINAQLESVILSINGETVASFEDLRQEIDRYSPGEKITLTVVGDDKEPYNKDIVLGESPDGSGRAWLGVGFQDQESSGVFGKIYAALGSFKKPHIYYEPRIDGVSLFIYNLLWWIVIISISVALVNMLPVGIFDGGRFFYLTILGLTKSEKIAKKTFSIVTKLFLLILLVLMIFWLFSFR